MASRIFFGHQPSNAAVNYSLVCAAGSYSYTGVDASLGVHRNYVLTCDAGAYVYSGVAATLTYAPGGVAVDYVLTCDAGAYAYSGVAAALAVTRNYALTCEAGAYSYTGSAATLTYVSGAPVTEPATDTHDGGWLPTRIKSKTHRKKFERLYEDMIALYEQLSTEAVAEVPMEKPAVADYVKPAPVVARAKVIPPPVIDWSALNRDMTRLYLLIEQNRQLIEDQDEEEAVMLLLM